MLARAEEAAAAAVEEREEVGEEGVAAAVELAAEDAEPGVCALLQREDGGGRGGREEGAPSFGGEVTPGRGWSEEEQTDRQQVWKHVCGTAEHTQANLAHLRASPVGTGPLRLGREDDAVRQPLIGLLAAPLRAPDPQFALQLLDETVLRAVFVDDDGPHLLALLTVTIHRVHVGGLLGASDHRLYLGRGGAEASSHV